MPTTRPRRRLPMLLGIAVIVGGLVAGVLLYVASTRRPDDAVEHFARAPGGCATTLDFTQTGTFYVYREVTGSIDDLSGDCDAATEYDSAPDDVGRPTVELTDPDGDRVELDRASEPSYDTGDFVGEAIWRFEIDDEGEYVIEAPAAGADYAAAVGRDPDDGVTMLRVIAALAAIGGLVLGILLLALSGRRRATTIAPPPPPGPSWVPGPGDGRPIAPPSMPGAGGPVWGAPAPPSGSPAPPREPAPPAHPPGTPPTSPWAPPSGPWNAPERD